MYWHVAGTLIRGSLHAVLFISSCLYLPPVVAFIGSLSVAVMIANKTRFGCSKTIKSTRIVIVHNHNKGIRALCHVDFK